MCNEAIDSAPTTGKIFQLERTVLKAKEKLGHDSYPIARITRLLSLTDLGKLLVQLISTEDLCQSARS